YHGDFSPITDTNPAHAGEAVIARVTGMGPTQPAVDPGKPFPDVLAQVNSPVAVTVNGTDGDVINAVGWPGTTNQYRVDFRIPDGTSAGPANVQISAAWILGTLARIPIR